MSIRLEVSSIFRVKIDGWYGKSDENTEVYVSRTNVPHTIFVRTARGNFCAFNDIQTGRYKLATEVLKTLAGSEKAVWYRQGKRGDGGAGTGTRRHCWKQI